MVGHVCFHYSVVSNEFICLDYEELKIIVNILWLLKGEFKYLSEYIEIYIYIYTYIQYEKVGGFFMEGLHHIGISHVFAKPGPPGLFSKHAVEGD